MCYNGSCNWEENIIVQIMHGVLHRQLCHYIGYKQIMFYKATIYQTVLASLQLWNYRCFTSFVCNVHDLMYETYRMYYL
jgi:hypothetical protein